jgi:hypothetical protein
MELVAGGAAEPEGQGQDEGALVELEAVVGHRSF